MDDEAKNEFITKIRREYKLNYGQLTDLMKFIDKLDRKYKPPLDKEQSDSLNQAISVLARVLFLEILPRVAFQAHLCLFVQHKED